MPEQDSSLAARIRTVADGQAPTALDRDILKLKLIDEALGNDIPWAVIARVLRYPSGPELKRDIRKLRVKVRREQHAQAEG